MGKGQLSIFIILGFIILFSLGLLYFLANHEEKAIVQAESSPTVTISLSFIKDYMRSCIDEGILEAVDQIGISEETLPMFKAVARQRIVACASQLVSRMETEGFEVTVEEFGIESIITDDALILNITYPHTFKKRDQKYVFESLRKSIPRKSEIEIPGGTTDEEIYLHSTDDKMTLTLEPGTRISDWENNPVEELGIYLEDRNVNGLVDNYVVGETVYDIQPGQLFFSQPVDLTLKFSPEQAGSYDPELVQVAWLDDRTNVWFTLPTDVICSDDSCSARTKITHATRYSALSGPCGENHEDEDSTYGRVLISPYTHGSTGQMTTIFSTDYSGSPVMFPKLFRYYFGDTPSSLSRYYYAPDFLGDSYKYIKYQTGSWTSAAYVYSKGNPDDAIFEKLELQANGALAPKNPVDFVADHTPFDEDKEEYLSSVVEYNEDTCDIGNEAPVVPIKYVSWKPARKLEKNKHCCCKIYELCDAGYDDGACWDCPDNDGRSSECSGDYPDELSDTHRMEDWGKCLGMVYDGLDFYPGSVGDTLSKSLEIQARSCLGHSTDPTACITNLIGMENIPTQNIKGFTSVDCAGGTLGGPSDPVARREFCDDGNCCLPDILGPAEIVWDTDDPTTANFISYETEATQEIVLNYDLYGCSEWIDAECTEESGCRDFCNAQVRFVQDNCAPDSEGRTKCDFAAEIESITVNNKEGFSVYTGDSGTDLLTGIGEISMVLQGEMFGEGSRICFVAGTKILTPKGEKNIEDIEVGDLVLSYNDANGETEVQPVYELIKRETSEIVYLELENGVTFKVTPEHPFFDGQGYKEIRGFTAGDLVYSLGLLPVKIASIEIKSETLQVYNIEVTKNRNYFAEGILVHNYNPTLPPCGCGPCDMSACGGQPFYYCNGGDNSLCSCTPDPGTNQIACKGVNEAFLDTNCEACSSSEQVYCESGTFYCNNPTYSCEPKYPNQAECIVPCYLNSQGLATSSRSDGGTANLGDCCYDGSVIKNVCTSHGWRQEDCPITYGQSCAAGKIMSATCNECKTAYIDYPYCGYGAFVYCNKVPYEATPYFYSCNSNGGEQCKYPYCTFPRCDSGPDIDKIDSGNCIISRNGNIYQCNPDSGQMGITGSIYSANNGCSGTVVHNYIDDDCESYSENPYLNNEVVGIIYIADVDVKTTHVCGDGICGEFEACYHGNDPNEWMTNCDYLDMWYQTSKSSYNHVHGPVHRCSDCGKCSSTYFCSDLKGPFYYDDPPRKRTTNPCNDPNVDCVKN